MATPSITDGVIVLDGHTFADVEAMVTGEDEELARRFGWYPALSTEQTGRAAVRRWQQHWRSSGSTRAFAVRERAAGTLVGSCELRLGEGGVAAMSYSVFAVARRRGYATRAVALACGYAFTELKSELIELHVAADNTASRGVARRAGFVEDPGPAGHGELGADELLYVRRAP